MSISDMIVVMKDGVVQQIGKPQEVYDSPINLFVAKFLGTPPINVFNGRVQDQKLYIGDDAVLNVKGVKDGEVYVGIRPEGFIVRGDGPFCCGLKGVEVMGRDNSVISTNPASLSPTIRSIISAESSMNIATNNSAESSLNQNGSTVRFSLKPHKVFLFDKMTEDRICFEAVV